MFQVVGDALQHLPQIEFRVEAVELDAAGQGVDRGGEFAAVIGFRKQEVLTPETDRAQRPFGGWLSISMVKGDTTLLCAGEFSARTDNRAWPSR